MRKIAFILFWAWAMFMAEFICYHLFSTVFYPNFLLLLVIFIDLFLGIRYGIFTAVLAGIIHDSASVGFFGVHIFSYLACAYITVILKRYIYMSGSRSSRLILVFAVALFYFITQFILQMMFQPAGFFESIRYVMLPQIFGTMITATFIFEFLKKCALKFYVS